MPTELAQGLCAGPGWALIPAAFQELPQLTGLEGVEIPLPSRFPPDSKLLEGA